MKATDPLIVELDRVAFLAADSDGRFDFVEHLAAVGAIQHSQSDPSHRRSAELTAEAAGCTASILDVRPVDLAGDQMSQSALNGAYSTPGCHRQAKPPVRCEFQAFD
jgi:hypothetical protein